MKIAIIGAGNVGRALATSSVRAGHAVVISSSDQVDAQSVASAVGATAAATNELAVSGADLVVFAVPYPAEPELATNLASALTGKIVVDVTNPLKPDLSGLSTATSAAEELQALLPKSIVVKALNTAFASRQADPIVDGEQLDGYVAADDAAAKAAVLDYVASIGFRPIDAGPLAMARSLEAMALLNITLQVRNGWPWQSGWKLVGPTAKAA